MRRPDVIMCIEVFIRVGDIMVVDSASSFDRYILVSRDFPRKIKRTKVEYSRIVQMKIITPLMSVDFDMIPEDLLRRFVYKDDGL